MIAPASRDSQRIRLVLARDWADRLKGLLGRARPPAKGLGLWIYPCRSVHTFGMKFPIDVAFISIDGKVCRLIRNLKPCRVAICLRAYSVVELAVSSGESCVRYRRRLQLALKRKLG